MRRGVRHTLACAMVILFCFEAEAQQNFKTGYFLDGYAYRYKFNPAFQGDRGFVSFPGAGAVMAGANCNVGIKNFLFTTEDGVLTTFMNPEISGAQFGASLPRMTYLGADVNLTLMSAAFWTQKSFHTIDISLRGSASVTLPRGLFSFMKMGDLAMDSYDIGGLGMRGEGWLEISYGYSRPLTDWMTFGVRAKGLVGLGSAQAGLERAVVTTSADRWSIEGLGTLKANLPNGVTIGTVEGSDRIDFSSITAPEDWKQMLRRPGGGAAFDIGFTFDFADYFTASVSLLDLGFLKWSNTVAGVTPGLSWTFEGIDEMDIIHDSSSEEGGGVSEQFDAILQELEEIAQFDLCEDTSKGVEMLPMTVNAGLEFRMPFWERMSVGAMCSTRIDGPRTCVETRGSLNIATCDVLSLAGSIGAAGICPSRRPAGVPKDLAGHVGACLVMGFGINLHCTGFNFVLGCDSLMPEREITRDYIPLGKLNTSVVVGINFNFGKIHSRFTKVTEDVD